MTQDNDFPIELRDGAIIVTSAGGIMPTQAEGTIDGQPFYFRARHGVWTLEINMFNHDECLPTNRSAWHDTDPVWVFDGDDDTSGMMSRSAVLDILKQCADEYFGHLIASDERGGARDGAGRPSQPAESLESPPRN